MKYELLEKLSLKCVLVGDSQCGKSSLAARIVSQDFKTEYVPTMFDNYCATITVDTVPYHFNLFDTSGRNDPASNKVRVMSYSKCDLFLVCFSVQDDDSLQHAEDRWVPEIRSHHASTPFILVGTKMDTKFETPDVQIISHSEESTGKGKEVAIRTNADGYAECSALSNDGIEDLIRDIVVTTNRCPIKKERPKWMRCCKFL